jgi:hypothetical protein
MTASSDVTQLLGLVGKLLNEVPAGNRSAASASTQDSSFADLLRQLATGLHHMADTSVSHATAPHQASVKAQASSVAASVQAQASSIAASVQAQASPVAASVAAQASTVGASVQAQASSVAASVAAQASPVAASVQAQASSVAASVASTSQTSTQTTAPAQPLSVESQEFYSTLEMNSCGGTVTFDNLTGNSADVLNVGDTWQFSIRNGPPNTPVRQLMDCWTYPPPYKTVGTTDAQGNLTLTGTVTQAQGGNQVWQPYYMQFPNTYAGYQDPNAPAGYRNVLIGGAEFAVQ